MKNRTYCKTIQRSQGNVENVTGCKIVFGILFVLFILFVFSGLGSAQAGPTLTTAGISPHQHAPMRLHGWVPGKTQSENWSGYAVTGSSFSFAKGSWKVPAVDCAKTPNTYSSFWVGIDGYSDLTVEQTGTESDCVGTTPHYFAWYEFFPAGSVVIASVPVSPGDVIGATVRYSGGKFTIGINNRTQGKFYNKTMTVSGAKRTSAEWIAEAPSSSSGGILPLADFGRVSFGEDYTGDNISNIATDSSTSGPISDFGSNVEEITMVSSKNVVEAVPTGLTTDGTSFRVYWKAE